MWNLTTCCGCTLFHTLHTYSIALHHRWFVRCRSKHFRNLTNYRFNWKQWRKNQFAHEWNYCYPPCNPFDFRERMGKKLLQYKWNIGKYANGKREKKTQSHWNKTNGKKMPNQNWKSILMSKIYLFSWLFANLESQINVLCSWTNWLGYINGIHTIRTWCMSALLLLLLGFCILGYLCHHSLNEMAYFLIDLLLLYNKNEGQNGNFMRNALIPHNEMTLLCNNPINWLWIFYEFRGRCPFSLHLLLHIDENTQTNTQKNTISEIWTCTYHRNGLIII